MTVIIFNKPFAQQEAISPEAIEEEIGVLQSRRLYRYNVIDGETGEGVASKLNGLGAPILLDLQAAMTAGPMRKLNPYPALWMFFSV